jgi:hypothetical protein
VSDGRRILIGHIGVNASGNSSCSIDISQYRLRFGFSLLYTDRVPFELLDSPALL